MAHLNQLKADYQSHQRNRKLEKSKPGLIMFNTSAQQNESITINELHEHIQKSITESRNKLNMKAKDKSEIEHSFPRKPNLRVQTKNIKIASSVINNLKQRKQESVKESKILNYVEKSPTIKLKLVELKDIE